MYCEPFDPCHCCRARRPCGAGGDSCRAPRPPYVSVRFASRARRLCSPSPRIPCSLHSRSLPSSPPPFFILSRPPILALLPFRRTGLPCLPHGQPARPPSKLPSFRSTCCASHRPHRPPACVARGAPTTPSCWPNATLSCNRVRVEDRPQPFHVVVSNWPFPTSQITFVSLYIAQLGRDAFFPLANNVMPRLASLDTFPLPPRHDWNAARPLLVFTASPLPVAPRGI